MWLRVLGLGFWGLGFWGLGFRSLGFWSLGFRGLGFWSLGFWGLGTGAIIYHVLTDLFLLFLELFQSLPLFKFGAASLPLDGGEYLLGGCIALKLTELSPMFKQHPKHRQLKRQWKAVPNQSQRLSEEIIKLFVKIVYV